ncbi:MAG: ribonucleotide reductase subunit alpha [Dokdonella sp.]
MMLSSFQDFLHAAREQAEPQRLLFTFAKVELPDAATTDQRERFDAKQGGTLSPSLCVDKAVEEVESFQKLVLESEQTGLTWDIVFVASLPGRAGVAPSADEAVQPLRFMVNAINNGRVADFAAFDRAGNVLQFC